MRKSIETMKDGGKHHSTEAFRSSPFDRKQQYVRVAGNHERSNETSRGNRIITRVAGKRKKNVCRSQWLQKNTECFAAGRPHSSAGMVETRLAVAT